VRHRTKQKPLPPSAEATRSFLRIVIDVKHQNPVFISATEIQRPFKRTVTLKIRCGYCMCIIGDTFFDYCKSWPCRDFIKNTRLKKTNKKTLHRWLSSAVFKNLSGASSQLPKPSYGRHKKHLERGTSFEQLLQKNDKIFLVQCKPGALYPWKLVYRKSCLLM